ncbi:MAG: ATP-binding protein [Candidatus Bipolaricaulaceae bacterium]
MENAIRAGATKVEIELVRAGSEFVVRVMDDGTGMDEEAQRRAGPPSRAGASVWAWPSSVRPRRSWAGPSDWFRAPGLEPWWRPASPGITRTVLPWATSLPPSCLC